ncbi:outer membrane protein assembly factor BamE [Pelagerythrobacter marensis]|uniref:Outer membrane protein assembly factor BamE n=1 Tax=Pelagerythrobacter marensis TaxID=543877 RepID=A0ABZ2D2X1_9SPHN
MNIRNPVIAAALAMTFAGSAGAAEPGNGTPTYRPGHDASVEFPAPRKATRKDGAFVPPRNVAMVAPGMTKNQIYTLLDVPHFHEGLFFVRKWNYILNFYTGKGDEHVACQYQIRFDKKARVENTFFRDAECVQLLDRLLAPDVVTVAGPATPAKPAKTYRFNFAFDSAEIDDRGHATLREAAEEVRAGDYREVIVTGFTDTMGDTDYNDALAARRAAVSASALRGMVGGIPVYARAARDLEVPTGSQKRELRNRQVLIELYTTTVDRPAPVTDR